MLKQFYVLLRNTQCTLFSITSLLNSGRITVLSYYCIYLLRYMVTGSSKNFCPFRPKPEKRLPKPAPQVTHISHISLRRRNVDNWRIKVTTVIGTVIGHRYVIGNVCCFKK